MKRVLRYVLAVAVIVGVAGFGAAFVGCKSSASSSESGAATYKCAMPTCEKTKPAGADGSAPTC